MAINKIPVYVKIDVNVKERAIMYTTKCKLLKKDTHTLNLLVEEALDTYMVNNPL